MLHVACCLWDANAKSQPFSRCYDESWVEKLYRGFARNLMAPFRFVCFTDRARTFKENIGQERLATKEPDYGCLIEPFRLDGPLIVCGLDMIVLRDVDRFARYCETETCIAAPRDPYRLERLINPIVLVPAGHRRIFDEWSGENDMDYLRRYPWKAMDDLWPGQILSLKAHDVRRMGTQNARVIYFHGEPKPPSLMHLDWVRENWS